MRVLIVGCGYVGLVVGTRLAEQGSSVTGIRRSPETSSEQEMRQAGITPLFVDITRPDAFEKLEDTYDWVINCVSSSKGSSEDYRLTYVQGTHHLLEWLERYPPRKFVYTSSTSVYPQDDGSIVSELSPAQPTGERGKILVETEKLVLAGARLKGLPTVILRLAGIYGPGRGYWYREFLNDTAVIDGNGKRILNMIHRNDAAGAIIAALNYGQPGEIYNVVDNEPVTQLAFFDWLAKRLGRSLPPSVSEPGRISTKRRPTNKRVSNAKLKTKLAYRFEYPTFREGYDALIKPGEPA